KGVRSLELGKSGLLFSDADADAAAIARGERPAGGAAAADDDLSLRKRLAVPHDRRLWDLFRALNRGWSVEQLHELTRIDPWFLRQFAEIRDLRRDARKLGLARLEPSQLQRLK